MNVQTLARPQLPARVNRSPRHSFKVAHNPWQLQPFMLAPVLPGETMTNLLVQSRSVTDPIKEALTGWWLEYYFFYVKLTDLDQRAEFQEMIIRPDNFSKSGLTAAAYDPLYYTSEGGIKWAEFCLKRVVEEYFRNEDETWNGFTINGLPIAAVGEERSGWWQSLIMGDDLIAMDVAISTAGDNAFTMSELEAARREYEISKAIGLQLPTWEDYLVQNGVRAAVAENPHRPELLRHIREWTYPTNTVEATTGVPTSACSWSIAERADKNRLFKEPGFIFGVTCARPKVYMANLKGSPAGFMDSPETWLPALLAGDAWSSMKAHVTTSDSGPAPNIVDAQGYAWDMRDLLLYGDQYVNLAADNNRVSLPTTAAQKDFATQADMEGLFLGAPRFVRQDGVVQLTIKGRQRDTTPPGSTGVFVV